MSKKRAHIPEGAKVSFPLEGRLAEGTVTGRTGRCGGTQLVIDGKHKCKPKDCTVTAMPDKPARVIKGKLPTRKAVHAEMFEALTAVRDFMDGPQAECPLPVEVASKVRASIAAELVRAGGAA